jgi:hypothetical protein
MEVYKTIELHLGLQPFFKNFGMLLLHSIGHQSKFLQIYGFPTFKGGSLVIKNLIVPHNPQPPGSQNDYLNSNGSFNMSLIS